MLIVESQSLDVYRNLAIEEALMDDPVDRGPILFLWRSEEAVVIGKNQNPWMECRLDWMERDAVPLARRSSGGGTVYHDAGNLNYCVVVSREAYREDQAYELIFAALARFGISAEKTEKSNLRANGLKFSGNAFAFRKGKAMHHGTLLLETDLDRLRLYLGSMIEDVETRAIASRPASVGNLSLNRAEFIAELKASFGAVYAQGADPVEWSDADFDAAMLESAVERLRSDAWRFGHTPKFAVKWRGERVEVEKGVVQSGRDRGKSFWALLNSSGC